MAGHRHRGHVLRRLFRPLLQLVDEVLSRAVPVIMREPLVHERTAPYDFAMTSMSASEARAALPDILTRVEGGEEVTITRHGRPVAVVVPPDVLRLRRGRSALQAADHIHSLMSAARAARPSEDGLTATRAEELVADVRAGRERS